MTRLEKLILNAQRKTERDRKAKIETTRRLIQWKAPKGAEIKGEG